VNTRYPGGLWCLVVDLLWPLCACQSLLGVAVVVSLSSLALRKARSLATTGSWARSLVLLRCGESVAELTLVGGGFSLQDGVVLQQEEAVFADRRRRAVHIKQPSQLWQYWGWASSSRPRRGLMIRAGPGSYPSVRFGPFALKAAIAVGNSRRGSAPLLLLFSNTGREGEG
jgi:hypothetical protein